jgi:hypothetical protein
MKNNKLNIVVDGTNFDYVISVTLKENQTTRDVLYIEDILAIGFAKAKKNNIPHWDKSVTVNLIKKLQAFGFKHKPIKEEIEVI